VPDDAILEAADTLYALPLPEFTPARDAMAKEHKGTDLGSRVKALKKPSMAAWVVDLFVRREADQVEQVLTVGAALREAQEAMAGEDLRALTKQRRQLTAAITQQARSLAAEAGVKVTQAVADQVEATLTAAMVDETCAQAVRSGMLVTALSTTGMDEVDVAGAVAVPEALGFVASAREAEAPGPPDLHVVPDPEADEKALAAAREALAEAEDEVGKAQSGYDAAVTDVEQLEARSMQLQAEIDELKRKLSDIEAAYEEADDELADAEDVRSEAQATLTSATRARDQARAKVASLEG
jgi:DNA repair exonuclease SbcCD ATPase subunit